ncbi:hypothetical protein [Haloprofundus salinisoli]|uniref:hypothetical protein n=1 Tax=Haloprofundus salinisoli TaxID=2876193 RepID=UPI001CC8F6D9|nr:hypothetical protein [Haloprofundus salinisoli]
MKAVYVLLVAVFVVVSSVPAAASVSTPSTADSSSQVDTDESRLGDDVTTFVQSTAAETRGVVANEKWEAEFDRNGDRAAVERRIDRLEAELADLRQRRDALAAAAENDTISGPQYHGRLGELDGELSALAVSIDATEQAAERVGANTSRLSTLRTETRETHANVAGPTATTAPLGAPSNRANSTDEGDGSAESSRFVRTSVGPAGEGADAFDGAGGGEDTPTDSDHRETNGGGDESPVERKFTADVTQPNGEAPGKEDVQGLRS